MTTGARRHCLADSKVEGDHCLPPGEGSTLCVCVCVCVNKIGLAGVVNRAPPRNVGNMVIDQSCVAKILKSSDFYTLTSSSM